MIFPSLLQHLSISNGNIQVDASFMQTLWNVHPICSGSNIEEGIDHKKKPNLDDFFHIFSPAIVLWYFFKFENYMIQDKKYINETKKKEKEWVQAVRCSCFIKSI